MADGISIKFGAEGDQTLKSALQAIDAEMKALNEQVKASTEAMKGMGDSEEASAKRTEALGNIVEASGKKMQILQQQYDSAKQKLDALAQALEQAKQSGDPAAIDKATIAYNKQSAEVSKLEGAMAKTEGEISKAQNAMASTGEEADETGEKMGKLAVTMSVKLASEAIGNVVAGFEKFGGMLKDVGKGIWDMATESSNFADDLATLATQTGINTQKLQEYQYAARFVDTEVSTITGSLVKLTNNMASTSESVTSAFDKLKISTRDSNQHLRDSETVFWEVIDALGKVANETERDQLAMTIFGKSAQQLNPLIQAGAQEWNKYAQEAQNMGLIVSEEGVGALGSFNDSLQRIDASIEAAKNQLSAALAPAFETLANAVSQTVQEFTKWIQTAEGRQFMADLTTTVSGLAQSFVRDLKPAIDQAIDVVKNVGDAVTWCAENFDKIVAAVKAAVAVYVSLKAVLVGLQIATLVTNPVGAAVAAIGALVAAVGVLVANWGTVKQAGAAAWEAIKSAWASAASWFSQIGTAIVNAFQQIPTLIGNLFRSAWQAVQSAWNSAVSWFTTIGTNVKNAFQQIPSAIGNFFSNAWQSVQNAWRSAVSWFTQIGTNIRNAFQAIPTGIGNFFRSAWQGAQSAWSSAVSFFRNIGTQIVTSISSTIRQLPTMAYSWARDMMQGFARGIIQFMDTVTRPIRDLAQKIAGFLHFSRPDEGPLRDYETWMPDFIKGLAKTLDASAPILENAAGRVASDLQTQLGSMTISGAQIQASQAPITLQVDGQTFARLMTPYIDKQQGSNWSSMALA